MLIETRDFGTVEVAEDTIIDFPDGVYGFEDSKRFVLFDTGSASGVMQLQCVDSPHPRFIVLDPFALVEDYAPQLPSGALEKLRAASPEQVNLFSIAVVPEDFKKATANLKSPVAIHFAERLGAQLILDNKDYPVRYQLFAPERTA